MVYDHTHDCNFAHCLSFQGKNYNVSEVEFTSIFRWSGETEESTVVDP
jgi:hypothetical protein